MQFCFLTPQVGGGHADIHRSLDQTLLAGELHPAEGFGDTLIDVVHAPLPCSRGRVIDEIVVERDFALLILEDEWKFVFGRVGYADGLDGSSAVDVEPYAGVGLSGIAESDEDHGFVLRLAFGVLVARHFMKLDVVVLDDPFPVDVMGCGFPRDLATEYPVAGEVVKERRSEGCLLCGGDRACQ